MTTTIRILGGIAIVLASFFVTLFILNYLDVNRDWKNRLLTGEPVVVHFNCGALDTLNCKSFYTISYKGRGKDRCEHAFENGQPPDITGWCNGRPEDNTFSITGALFSFSQSGAVMRGDKIVGQLTGQ